MLRHITVHLTDNEVMHELVVQSDIVLSVVVMASQTRAFSFAHDESRLLERRRPQTYERTFGCLLGTRRVLLSAYRGLEVHGDFELGLKVINRIILDDRNRCFGAAPVPSPALTD